MVETVKLEDEVFIFDNIVTSKTAAAILKITTQNVNAVLKKFAETLKKDDKQVYVTYVIGGVLKSNGKHRVIVVTAENYDEAKANYSSTFIDQIYSIQKSAAISWDSIFNVNDFLYDECKPCAVNSEPSQSNEVKTFNPIKKEQAEPKTSTKKGSLSTFFSQSSSSKSNGSTSHESKNTNKKEEKKKSNDIQNLFKNVKLKSQENSGNTNGTTSTNGHSKTNIDDSDDEDSIQKGGAKKRCRVLDDDDDSVENINKQAKVDILDDNSESDNELMNTGFDGAETEVDENVELVIDEVVEPMVVETDCEPPVKEEPNDIMYKDAEGFFVTEKSANKKVKEKTPIVTEEEKKEIVEKQKIEKKMKKEINEKLKKNNNQKTLFNFFKKV